MNESEDVKTEQQESIHDYSEFEENRRFSVISGVEGPGVLDIIGGTDDSDEQKANELSKNSSSVIRFYPEWCECFECLKHRGPYSPNASFKDNLRNAILCPPQGPTSRFLAFVLVFLLGWIFFWFILINIGPTPYKSPASPFGGPIFSLGLIEIIGLFSGMFMKCLRLPSLLGPLLVGIFIKNVEAINLFKNLEGWEICNETNTTCESRLAMNSGNWIKPIRQIALTMILTRAGLELSPKQLKKLKGVVPLLAFGPCIVEACCCALFSWIFFNVLEIKEAHQMNPLMCLVSGFALAAVSPAVVVPGMLSMKKKNLGVGQGIPTLLIAASSIDDVLAISAYTIFLGLAVAKDDDDLIHKFGGVISIFLGIFHGLFIGIFLHFIPSRDNKKKAETRLILLLLFNLLAIIGYDLYELLSGAGSLAVLVTSFIASFGWRSQPHWKKPMHKIEKSLARIWTLCVPLLFGTIGREINFKNWDGSQIGKIFAVILLCLAIRCMTAFLIVGILKLNNKEKLFCALSWIPKATVQAALAPLVLTKIQDHTTKMQEQGISSEKDLKYQGEIVVTTAVLAILITAPLGSILIAHFGPRLLRTPTAPEKETLEQEFPNGDGLDPSEDPPEITFSLNPPPAQPVVLRRTFTGEKNEILNNLNDKEPSNTTEPSLVSSINSKRFNRSSLGTLNM